MGCANTRIATMETLARVSYETPHAASERTLPPIHTGKAEGVLLDLGRPLPSLKKSFVKPRIQLMSTV